MKELVLHIGMMKTATTYLQSVLQNNRKELEKQGWLYPGKHLNHQREAYGLCGKNIPWYREILARDIQLGREVVEEVKTTPNSVIISSEALSSLDEVGIKDFVSKIGQPSRIVITVRSLYNILPSAWQQYVKGGSVDSFEKTLDKFIQARGDLSGPWRTYAYGAIARKWANIAEVHTVIIPTTRKEGGLTTWELFQEACGLPSVKNSEVPVSQSNISLPLEGVNFLIEVNKAMNKNKKLTSADKTKILNAYLRNHAYPAVGKIKGTKISPPNQHAETIALWDEKELALLSQSSTRVYGALSSLIEYTKHETYSLSGEWSSSEREVLEYVAAQTMMNIKDKGKSG